MVNTEGGRRIPVIRLPPSAFCQHNCAPDCDGDAHCLVDRQLLLPVDPGNHARDLQRSLNRQLELPRVGRVAMYGGSTTSILLNTRGESATIVTAIEGRQMAKAGRGGAALATAAIGSFVAGTLATLGLALLAPPMVKLALALGPAEYFALIVLAFAAATSMLGASRARGMVSLTLGLTLGLVLILASVGAYSVHGAILDLVLLGLVGLLGYGLRAGDFPVAPVIIGLFVRPDGRAAIHARGRRLVGLRRHCLRAPWGRNAPRPGVPPSCMARSRHDREDPPTDVATAINWGDASKILP